MLNKFLRAIDRITRTQEWTSAVIVMLMLVTVYAVIMRYIWKDPPIWGMDIQVHMLSFILLFSIAYTLLRGQHVRIDLVANKYFSQRGQDILGLIGYVIFFLPFTLVLFIRGLIFFLESWALKETAMTPWGPVIYPMKGFIPLAALMLLLQGLAEMIRHFISAIKGGSREC
jgi:TRAP-type mannitol/chloroaromatic compound transport system permease small subunit